MEKLKLTNFKIIEKESIKGDTYFIIFDDDNEGGNNAYFCWQGTLKTGWEDLKNNYDNLKEIEIEWEAKEKWNRVINLWSDADQGEFLF